MPSPLEKIESGLKSQNFKLIDDAYFELTGKRVLKETKSKAISKQPKLSKKPTQEFRPMPRQFTEVSEEESDEKKEATRQPVKIGKKVNLFYDDGSEGKNN